MKRWSIWVSFLMVGLVATTFGQDERLNTGDVTMEQLRRLAGRIDGNPLIKETDVRVELSEPTEAHKKRSEALRRYARLAYLMQDEQYEEVGRILGEIEEPRIEWPEPLRILEVRYLLETRQSDDAYMRAASLVAEHPEAIEAYILIADIEHLRQNYDAVIDWLEKGRKIAPRHQQLLQNLGRRYEFSMQTAKTTEEFSLALNKMEEVYGDLVETLPGRRGARYLRLLAYISEKNDHKDKALEYMRRLVRVMPGEIEYVVKLSELEIEQGNMEEARAVLRKALIREPANEELRAAIQNFFQQPGAVAPGNDPDTALIDFYRAVAKEYPGRDALQIEVARLLIQDGLEEEALEILRESLDFHPQNQQTRLLLAELYGSLENEEEAVALLQDYMEQADRDSLSMRTSVAMMMRHGFDVEAEELLKEIIQKEPEQWRIRLMLVDLYDKADNGDAVEPLLKETAEHFQEDPEVLFQVAMRAWDTGKIDFAEELLKKVVRMQPDHAEAHNSLGYFLTEQDKELDEALRLIKRAMELNPGQGHIMDSLGWVYYKKGLYEKAIQTLEDANKLLKPEAETIEHLAWAYLAAGRDTEALAHFKIAIELLEMDDVNSEKLEKLKTLKREVEKLKLKQSGNSSQAGGQ